MGKFVDRSGMRFGRLVVIGRVDAGPASKGSRVKWRCICDCGTEKVTTGHSLACGDATSCGCLQREIIGAQRRTHGLTRTPAYRSWRAAKERCHNPKSSAYSSYGAKGIFMCDRWRNSFEAFLEDMGERPEGMTIDRLDQCKGYEPGNCRWATNEEQHLTRGSTRLYRWRGTWMTPRQISDAEGIPFNTLRKIVRHAPTIQAAVSQAKAKRRNFRAA